MLLDVVDNQHHSREHVGKPSPVPGSATTTLPTRLKHTRQRSSSCGATFYSSTIVPAPYHSEALSSLINSLTSIAEAQRAGTLVIDLNNRPRTATRKAERGDIISSIATNPDFHKVFYDNKTPQLEIADVTGVDEDFCPPPVAGYNTINADKHPQHQRTAGGKTFRRFKDRKAQPELKSSKSSYTLKSSKSSRELRSPDSTPSLHPGSLYGNESEASLSLSTNSKLSRVRNPLKMMFGQATDTERNRTQSGQSGTSVRSESFETCSSSMEKDKDKDRDLRFSAFVTLGRLSVDSRRKESDAKTDASMSPTMRTDLSENLIPSRRSSLRSATRRSSRGSKDLRSLNIDQDLIEENHGTVQRIRELHEAREKRHKEWRREAKRSDSTSKRLSMPSPGASPVKSPTSNRSSWHAKVTENSQKDAHHNAFMTPNVHPSSPLPPFAEIPEDQPPSPLEQHFKQGLDTDVRPNDSFTPSPTPPTSSGRGHRKRLSESIRRASTLRSPVPDDARAVVEEVEAFLASPRLTQRIRHPRTGRTIAFSEIGDPDGFVVFCCVGMGLTRFVTTFYDETAKTQKLRIITLDRPGVGETDPMPVERNTPLAWVDDVAVVCSSLGIEKFSLLAHSAGAIYALAAALKMPQYVRGRIHLLAPWIPPSQLAMSNNGSDLKSANLPTSHKLLSLLPTSFMRAANSRFLSAASASIEPRSRKDKKKDSASPTALTMNAANFDERASLSSTDFAEHLNSMLPTPDVTPHRRGDLTLRQPGFERVGSPNLSPLPSPVGLPRSATLSPTPSGAYTLNGTRGRALSPEARERLYNTTLTHKTWALATLNANPAVDLITCLERRRPVGFRYTDVTRAVVIHHGANDARVPLENVQWLSKAMKRCELRVLPNESHGLMASAVVMTNVLAEIGKEWDEWNRVAKDREEARKEEEAREIQDAREREKGVRKGYPRW